MPTLEELAKRYAQTIRDAARPIRKGATAITESHDDREARLGSTVRRLLEQIDGLTYADDTPLDEMARENLYRAVERELSLENRTIRQLKEASIQSTLAYERLISALLAQLAKG